MKPDRHDWFRVGGALSQPRDYSAESIPPPEIVGEVTNLVLEISRRLWWRALDGVCYCIVLIRLSIQTGSTDQNRPYPPTWNLKLITTGSSRPFQ
jgi:hypothetical protein